MQQCTAELLRFDSFLRWPPSAVLDRYFCMLDDRWTRFGSPNAVRIWQWCALWFFELLQQSISWFWLSPFFRGWEGRSSVPGNCWNEPYQIWREHRPLIGSGNFRFTIFCYFLKIRGLAGILGRKLRPYLQFFIPCTIEGRNGRNIWVAFSSSA